MEPDFDNKVLKRINEYIQKNGLSLRKIAAAAGMDYVQLWSLLKRKRSIKLSDYVALCQAFREPLDIFLPKESVYKTTDNGL